MASLGVTEWCFIMAIIIVVFMIGYLTGWFMCAKSTDTKDTDLIQRYMFMGSMEAMQNNKDKKTSVDKAMAAPSHPDKKQISHQMPSEKVEDLGYDDKVVDRHVSSRGGEESISAFADWKKNIENPELTYWQ